ncbi:MAG: Butyrate--acetoacetate CoA-transferase subunit A [candidate division WS2 bacterium]|uniref:Butyrate--acetoacetate CoA-transferase subunit A n=1 Tax=Psychracetigena formicireducens TaxID=2986056 RepID=A0A9E2F7E9_PSYF1|nr:Butyrate--acetoacetate CoA-transferase subunit A [Candidatus Psychracetigena formicireducens]MBT9145498.1 Butyrate--acetoacetate CoA-transferase subunit A [Candidatus Psychracetigena formicireducens]
MLSKLVNKEDLPNKIKLWDGMTILVAGFLGNGTPERLIDFLLESEVKNLKIIVNDTSYPGKGVARLIEAHRVKNLVTTHIGTNPETQKQFNNQELNIEFSPQGTLLERIRAGGSGLGGILTPVGIGTPVEEGKQKIIVNEKEYILELPLTGDLSILKARKADRFGNLLYYGTSCNFNPVMSLSGKTVIAQVDEIVEVGELDPNLIATPGILVDYIIQTGK